MSTLLAAYKKEAEQTVTEEELSRLDSMTLHVAVHPCQETLPIYYAVETGLTDSLGVSVELLPLTTMEDCDTALINGRAEVAASDIARAICMRKDGVKATIIAQMEGDLRLFSAKGKRITAIKQLKERLVAMERHSESDYWSDEILKGTTLDRLDIFRVQFNDQKLREKMLQDGLIEAAFLNEPYASLAEEGGAKELWRRDAKLKSWMTLLIPQRLQSDTARHTQISRFLRACVLATKAINEKGREDIVKDILKKDFHLSYAQVDTLESLMPKDMKPYKAVLEDDVNGVKQWLVGREWIKQSLNTDSIFTNKFFVEDAEKRGNQTNRQ